MEKRLDRLLHKYKKVKMPRKRGQKWSPTNQQRTFVQMLKGAGWTDARVANALDIDVNTLKKYCSEDLKIGKDKIHGVVISKLMQNIMAGDKASIFFYLKTRCGWREKDPVDLPAEIKAVLWDAEKKIKAQSKADKAKTKRKLK